MDILSYMHVLELVLIITVDMNLIAFINTTNSIASCPRSSQQQPHF